MNASSNLRPSSPTLGTRIHHAPAPSGAVGTLVIAVIEAPLGGAQPSRALGPLASRVAATAASVELPSITLAADEQTKKIAAQAPQRASRRL
ncbi:hypothetical protein [Sorangium sp. So ce1182]|uniref:hypothetical protein n=1 Tax=Sorangium sp. So ce1182 TaxID=3133334 RepID=UPI003F602C43